MTSTASGGRPPSGRSAAIEGARGAAALALLTVHVALFTLFGSRNFGEERPPTNFLGAALVSGLPSFIGIFFVLPSLFLYLPLARAIIAGEPRPPRQGPAFVRRLLRLLPGYYVLCVVAMIAFNRDEIDGLGFLLRPFLLLQVYMPSPFAPKLINGLEITWTVPTMVQWYAALPVIAWVVQRFARHGATPAARARRLLVPVPVLVAVGIAWVFVVKGNGWDNRIVFWWPQGFAPAIGVGMALAILLALAQVQPSNVPGVLRLAARRPGLFWAGAAGLYVVNCLRPFSVIGMDSIYSTAGLLITYLMMTGFGLCVVLPLTAPGGRGGPRIVMAVLTSRPLVHVGSVSYGVYLWHFAVMHFYLQGPAVLNGGVRPIREFYRAAGFWELELVAVAGSVLIATISMHLVERPVAAFGERILRRYEQRSAEQAHHSPPTPDDTRTDLVDMRARRDVVRANVLALETQPGAQLLSSDLLRGSTARAGAEVRRDLAETWEIFEIWSDVLDRAADANADQLLDSPSVVLRGRFAPLASRHIDDSGEQRMTPDEAVGRMDELFRRAAVHVTDVDDVLDDVGPLLEGDPSPVSAAAPLLTRLRVLAASDPLELRTAAGRELLDRVRRMQTPHGAEVDEDQPQSRAG